jgi:hypothetical protein
MDKEIWMNLLKVDTEKGTVDLDQLWKELEDYSSLIDLHCFTIDLISGGRFSKPFYTKESIRTMYEEGIEDLREEEDGDLMEEIVSEGTFDYEGKTYAVIRVGE